MTQILATLFMVMFELAHERYNIHVLLEAKAQSQVTISARNVHYWMQVEPRSHLLELRHNIGYRSRTHDARVHYS